MYAYYGRLLLLQDAAVFFALCSRLKSFDDPTRMRRTYSLQKRIYTKRRARRVWV